MYRTDYSVSVDNTSVLDSYLEVPEKYVFSFQIKEKDKTRNIITYNKGKEFGEAFRRFHSSLAEKFERNFFDRNEHSFAYHKHIGTLNALDDHLRSNYFIKLDIHHFFESITEERFFAVYGERFNKFWTENLRGCFYRGALSIGFVTSPVISNFYMSRFDETIAEFVNTHPQTHYSRYSDDILLSSENSKEDLDELYILVVHELSAYGLELNEKKTRTVELETETHNSVSFLGLNISKLDEIYNKVTISKKYILFLLSLIEKNNRYESKCKELINEINSRVAYLAYNSPISYERFQKKYFNIYGVSYEFIAKKPLERKAPVDAREIEDYSDYTDIFDFDLHAKVVNPDTHSVVLNDSVQIVKYKGNGKTVVIPDFVDSIGCSAFRDSSVETVILHDNVRAVCEQAFAYSSLKEINLPDRLSYIGGRCFISTKKLTDITLPEKLKRLGNAVFYESGLKKVTFGSRLIAIGDDCFRGCALGDVALPDTVVTLGSGAFAKNIFLQKVRLSSGLLSVSESAFEMCASLTDAEIPEGVLSLENMCFSGCVNLKSVTIPSTVVNISNHSFGNCRSLKNIEIAKENDVYVAAPDKSCIIDKHSGALIYSSAGIPDGITAIGNGVFTGTFTERIALPEGITSIGDGAFAQCKLLKEITLPDSLETVRDRAFMDCISLEKIDLSHVKTLGEAAFSGCKRLEHVVLPAVASVIPSHCFENCDMDGELIIGDAVVTVGYRAFANAHNVKRLHIGKNVRKIYPFAFIGFAGTLEEITVDPVNKYYRCENNCLIETRTSTVILGCKCGNIPDGIIAVKDFAFASAQIGSLTLSSSVKHIGRCAFADCKNLKTLDLGNVYDIGDKAFFNTAIETLSLPTTLSHLGMKTFAKTKIKKVSLPISLCGIGSECFADNARLTEIEIPNISVELDFKYVFARCTSVSKITIDDSNPNYSAKGNCVLEKASGDCTLLYACNGSRIPNDENIVKIDCMAFSYATELTDVTIPATVRILDNGCFVGAVSLKTVHFDERKIPLSISSRAFFGCRSLEEISLPSVCYIFDDCFANCTALCRVSFAESDDVTIGNGIFTNCRNLEKVDMSRLSGEVGAKTFCGCTSLKEVLLSEDITFTDTEKEFFKCKNLEKVDYPFEVFGENMFAGCRALSQVDLSRAKVIESGAFSDIPEALSLCFPDGLMSLSNMFGKGSPNLAVTYPSSEIFHTKTGGLYKNETLIIGTDTEKSISITASVSDFAFYGNSGIETVSVSDFGIGEMAFSSCPNLKEVVLNTKTVGSMAFSNCASLEKITIGPDVEYIGSHCFEGCPSVGTVIVDPKNAFFTDLGHTSLFDSRHNSLILGTAATVIPENTEKICSGTFFRADFDRFDLKNVAEIEEDAFAECSLASVLIPKSCVNLAPSAFRRCYRIKSVAVESENPIYRSENDAVISHADDTLVFACGNTVVPEGVARIETGAFDSVDESYSLYIPKTCEAIGDLNKDFASIEVDPKNPVFDSRENANAVLRGKELVLGCRNTLIPLSVTSLLPNSVFGVKDVFIHKNVTAISVHAFDGCPDIQTIDVDGENPIYDSRENCNAVIASKSNIAIVTCASTVLPADTVKFESEGLSF